MDNKNQNTIMINKDEFNELKRLYSITKKGEVFLFKGELVLNDYAKYLIEFLEPKFKSLNREKKWNCSLVYSKRKKTNRSSIQ